MDIGLHLEELRRRLITVIVSVSVLTGLGFFLSDFLISILVFPARQQMEALYFFTPYEAFLTKLKVALACGILLSLPVIFNEFWRFIGPGLYGREKKLISVFVFASSLLFMAGVVFAYFIVLPVALTFFLGFKSASLYPLISIDSYISFFLTMLFIFGIAFNFPILLIGLMMTGVVPSGVFRAQRKTVIVLIFVLSAILTPTTDIVTQVFLAVPLYFLFEISLLIGRSVEKKPAVTGL